MSQIKSRKSKVVHRGVYNGCTVCNPMGEGKAVENIEISFRDSEVTCKKCLKNIRR